MIVPMKKFILVLMEKDLRSAPLYLRKLGIAHVEKFESSGEDCAVLETELKQAKSAVSILESFPKTKEASPASHGSDVRDLIAEINGKNASITANQDGISSLKREIDRISPWGDFSPELAVSLAEAGRGLRLYECQTAQLSQLPQDARYLRLVSPKGKAHIAVLDSSQLPAEFAEFKLPAFSLSELKAKVARAESEILELKKSLQDSRPLLKTLEKETARLESELTIERLRSGIPGQASLRYLTGFVPASEAGKLKDEAARRGWALAVDDPSAEDFPPTKVENHPAIRIIQPVFQFLGTVPNYREYDISAPFLMFFALYFAMIFGDGGYGVLLLAGALAMLFKSRKAKKQLSDIGRLLFVLSLATMAWGAITATWFAIPFASLPGFLKAIAIPALSSDNPESGTNVKIFCFLIGALQLAIAHIKNIRRDFPNLKFLAQIGSLIMVGGMLDAVLNLVIDSARFPLYSWALALIGVGFVLVFVFGNWDGNLFRSMMEGLKGIIPTFLGTVSVFADIVSYIRLWAVGLAGLAISQTVNGMAGEMFGPVTGRIIAFIIGAFMGVILIFVGHSINFLMSILSVIVHGIRLNMLEFSSHLGMEWSGYKYEPLSEPAGDSKTQEKTT
jgi:V/A-type H+-transporting ATPase subunit I